MGKDFYSWSQVEEIMGGKLGAAFCRYVRGTDIGFDPMCSPPQMARSTIDFS